MYWIELVGFSSLQIGISLLTACSWLSGCLLAGFLGIPDVAFSCSLKRDQHPEAASAARYYPNIRWHVSSVVWGDFSCRGLPQAALAGETAGVMHVAIFRTGPRLPPDVLEFSVPLRSPTSSQLQVIPLKRLARMARLAAGGFPDGLRPQAPCDAIRIDDSEVDAAYIYWNYNSKRFSSWQN
ncbi:hypothetical protein FQK07_14060 [Synechococcus sp. BSF8S]|uniref:hypothetical protein n=1 Tax=Synechococcales TaxID=1890424 RepID=UPI00162A04AA|nr:MULTISPECIES: hypothetical protein [unclassified Synechococcus]MBC1262359.1 hypothetical protein [Synechococcus sp. BSF8S]MBC1265262.1 hypothetical protein [Synechococcus sp. BSA11S]